MLSDDNTPSLDPGSQHLVNVTKSDFIFQKCQAYPLAILLFQYNSVMLNFSLQSLYQWFFWS